MQQFNNKYFIYISLLIISCSPLKAQISCKGKIDNLPANNFRRVVIEYWAEDRWLESDTANLATDFSFHKKITHDNVQARLRIHGQSNRWIDFFVPKYPSKDSVFDFGVIDYNTISGNPAKLSGKENEAYFNLISDSKKYKVLKENIATNDSITVANPGSLKQLEELRSTLNDHCKETAVKLKGTFVGDILTNLLYVPVQKEYANDKRTMSLTPSEFERKHLLDKIPFDDKRILLHNGFIKALNNYQSKFTKTDTTELYLYIDRVMFRRQGNTEVDAWLFHFLFNKFVGNRDDISLTYLLKFYVSDCETEESNPNQNSYNMLTALKNCEVGKKAFNFKLPDTLGANLNLEDIASKHKLTLLFFWRSDCSHCREFEPELAKIYEKYKPLGLEVIGVSLDHDEFKWRLYLQAYPMHWINLHVPNIDQRELINKYFPIPGTPSLVAVDKNSIVLNRMVNRTTLENYLDQYLSKIELLKQ